MSNEAAPGLVGESGNTQPPEWLLREFDAAAKRSARVPKSYRPVVTRPNPANAGRFLRRGLGENQ